MSLSDLNCHLSQVLGKHAPVCQRKIRQRTTTPWHSSVARQLCELKRERRRAECRWRSWRLAVHKRLYDTAKQKITDLVHDAKTSFYSAMMSYGAKCKELFHNTTTLLGKASKPSLPSVYDLQQRPDIFNDFFKNKILSIRGNVSLTARKIDDCQSTFSGASFLSFTPVSEELVKTISSKLSYNFRTGYYSN